MSLAADFEMLALEVELFAPAAEFAVVVAQFWVKAVGNAGSLQAVEVEQTAETEPAGIGPWCPLKAVEGIASVGFRSQLAKWSQEQLVQLALEQGEKTTVEPLGELVGGSVEERLVEFQSWHLLRLHLAKLVAAEKVSLAAEVPGGR